MSDRRPTVIVVSAPSGAGKTTILARVLRDLGGIRFSVSHTTRPPRGAERDGVEYHFVDQEAFLRLREAGGLLEWAEVHGNLYGTGVAEIERASAAGVDILLDLDVQGAAQVRQRIKDAVTVFILPPSYEVLESPPARPGPGRRGDDKAAAGGRRPRDRRLRALRLRDRERRPRRLRRGAEEHRAGRPLPGRGGERARPGDREDLSVGQGGMRAHEPDDPSEERGLEVPLHHGGGPAGQAAAGGGQAAGRHPQPQAHPDRGRGDDRRDDLVGDPRGAGGGERGRGGGE